MNHIVHNAIEKKQVNLGIELNTILKDKIS